MSADGRLRRRHRLSTAMVVVAAAVTVATSPPYVALEEGGEGVAFDLSADASEVRIPFEFDLSDTARREGDWRLQFGVNAAWRGVPEEQQALSFELVDAAGTQIRFGTIRSEAEISCRVECLGGGELVLSWLDGVERGSARVDWSYRAIVEFDRSDIPSGASVTLEIVDPPPPTSSADLASGWLDGLVADRVRLDLETSDSNGELWLDVVSATIGDPPLATFYVRTDDSWIDVGQWESALLEPPGSCPESCAWSADLVLVDESYPLFPEPRLSWRLTQTGGSAPAEVDVVELRPVVLRAQALSGSLTLGGDGTVRVPIRVTANPAALRVDDFARHDPQVVLTLYVDGRDVPDEGSVVVEIEGLEPARPGASRLPTTRVDSLARRQLEIPIRLQCPGNGACGRDLTLEFTPEKLAGSTPVVAWRLEAELVYPFAADVPPRAGLTLERAS